jgi:hypothetical protein
MLYAKAAAREAVTLMINSLTCPQQMLKVRPLSTPTSMIADVMTAMLRRAIHAATPSPRLTVWQPAHLGAARAMVSRVRSVQDALLRGFERSRRGGSRAFRDQA